ncbi:V-set and transmembrane domain-containing protein 4a isoform X1 [Hypanus sabinus]|uniref:V-set and transmembrane domain-containing protein 4a isoform X1 n=1 Tax=Hypanus sabinus TaxID=79690 RepID=UPI0028C42B1C|nr:V-set and transmembrane domain-containing protein 4a isoform X1 [Hypanus sabinus]
MQTLGVVLLLTKLLITDFCEALSVIVTPGPVVEFTEGQRGSLFCRVSQQRRKNSYLSLVWFFSNAENSNQRILRVNRTSHVQAFRNCKENHCELQFFQQGAAKIFVLIIDKLHSSDEGHYRCRVQEIAYLNRRWLSISNGENGTEVRVRLLQTTTVVVPQSTQQTWAVSKESLLETSTLLISRNTKEEWKIFEVSDLYLYVTSMCSVGILSVMLFAAVIVCQILKNRKKTKARKYLTNELNSSSGEMVTNTVSSSIFRTKSGKKTIAAGDAPPPVPVKIPRREASTKRKFLNKHDAKSILPRIVEDSLTYAELELTPTHPTAPPVTGSPTAQSPTTVYAKIFFSKNQS